MKQLATIAANYNASVIAVKEVPINIISSYGVIAIKNKINNTTFEIDSLVEKPSQDTAPSHFAIIGRYILSKHIFSFLNAVQPGANNEIQLTDGISAMLNNGHKVFACIVDTHRYDIGNPLGWLQANIAYGLAHPHYGKDLTAYLHSLI